MDQEKHSYTVDNNVEAGDSSISSTHSQERDDSYDIYKRYRGNDYTPEEAKAVLRKIDVRVVPILFVIYLIQYLDKNSINFASVYGLKTATKLKGQDYSWLSKLYLPCLYLRY